MKGLASGLMASFLCSAPLFAQERDRSLERIAVALRQPTPIVHASVPPESDLPRKIGPFTLVSPVMRGEMVRVSVPVGDLLTRAVHGVTAAHLRRREMAARRKVAAAIKSFEEQKGR